MSKKQKLLIAGAALFAALFLFSGAMLAWQYADGKKLNYRVQVVNQNCCYNQPPHLSVDPSIVYAGNPNQAQQKNEDTAVSGIETGSEAADVIYTLQGIRIERISAPGLYIVNGKKVLVR